MPSYEFEIGNFVSSLLLENETDYELEGSELLWKESYLYPYDPYVDYGWYEAFTDEIPEVDFLLAVDDDLPIYIFPTLAYEEEDIPFDVEYSPTFNYDQFEIINFRTYRWTLNDEDYFFTFSLFLWKLSNIEEFLIIFPSYWLDNATYFDFEDVTFNPYQVTTDEFSLPLPLIYFENPYFEDEFGDLEWVAVTYDEYPVFPSITWTLSNTDYILDDITPSLTLSLATLDEFYSLITAWITATTDTFEPSSYIWKNKIHERFTFYPAFSDIDYLLASSEMYDSEFYLFFVDSFDFVPMMLVLSDYMGDVPIWEMRTEDLYEFSLNPDTISYIPNRHVVRRRFSDIPVTMDFFRLPYFLYNTIFEAFIDWVQIGFMTYFDFEDFECRELSVQEYCNPRYTDDFEIAYYFEQPRAIVSEDNFSMEEDTPQITFHNTTIDNFYDFNTYIIGSKDYFEFISESISPVPVDSTEYNFSYPILWADPIINSFDTPVTTPYLLHTEDVWTFVINPITYDSYLEDDFDSIQITVKDVTLRSSESTLIKKNGKIMGWEYWDYEQ